MTASKAPSSKGRALKSPTRKSTPGTSRRAMAIIPAAPSSPTTSAPAACAAAAAIPVPQPTSSTRSPGCNAARRTTSVATVRSDGAMVAA